MGALDTIGKGAQAVFAPMTMLFGKGTPPPTYDNSPLQTDPSVIALHSHLADLMGGLNAPDRLNAESLDSGYKAQDFSGALPEYDYARNKATSQINAEKSANQDAIARRFAAMGNLNSGAYAKATQMSDQGATQATADAMQGIGAQEAQAKRGLQQAEQNKVFQSQEAIRGRNFGREQTNAAMQNQFNQFKTQFDFDANSKIAQMDLANRNSELDRRQKAYEAELATYQAKHSGGLFGAGGFLGTGIGA